MIAGRAAACNGPVARILGVLAALAGRDADAERHFGEALATSEAMGTGRWLPVCASVSPACCSIAGDGERERALELLGTALAEGQEMGMVGLTDEALALRLDAQGLGAIDVSTSIDFMADAISSEQPDIAALAAPDGQVTILFSDIEDSTLITERLGDQRWLEVLRAHNALFRRLVCLARGIRGQEPG